jgi:cytochrome c-type biogenesis protein CcmH
LRHETRRGGDQYCGTALQKTLDVGIERLRICAMRRILNALYIAAALSVSDTCLAYEGPDRLSDPAREARAVALQKQLRCVVCQGQSLDESNAPLAADLRRLIRTHIEKGETDAQIEHYLVARYGNFILMKPPLELDTYALWFGPLVVLLAGGAGAVAVVMRASSRMRETV